MDVIDAIHTRRSIRSYASRPVSRDLIEEIIWDAAQAPPPHSGQVPWTFNVVEGVERIAAYGNEALQYAQDNHPDESGWDWTDRPGFQVFWGAPVVIIISGRIEDCCRAGQNLMLSAHARGLGTCWVGSPMLWLRTTRAKALLKIPSELTPVSVFCLGYPAAIPEAPPAGERRPRWLGYTLGYRIVGDWLAATPEVGGDLLVNVAAETVLAAASTGVLSMP